jgi:hypothetical protein
MPIRDRKKEDALSLEEVRSLLSYDPETGALNWIRPPRRGVGIGPAGCIQPDGYKLVGYKGHLYMAIHLIWFIQTGEWPEHGVDHKDLDKSNDRWSNLRQATYSQNNCNRGIRKDNTTGVRGVGWSRNSSINPYTARIRKDGIKINLGAYATLAEAAKVRRAAEIKYFGEFAPAAEVI